jgi:DNA-binding CsgD family transcriptional regulator
MSTPVLDTEPDVMALADVTARDRSDVPAQGLPSSLLSDLARLIPCDRISVSGYDSVQELTWFRQALENGDQPEQPASPADQKAMGQLHWMHYWDCQSCSYPDRSGDRRRVIGVSDFYTQRQWHSTGMYHDVYRPQGLEHGLNVCLTMPAGPPGRARTVRMFLARGPGADFSDRDRAVLRLLAPHLRQAYRDAELRRHGQPQLTARHWDLLRLVAAGHTNTQIARRLSISEGTVRKHLENIYGRLGVSSRTAAVTRAFPDRLAS